MGKLSQTKIDALSKSDPVSPKLVTEMEELGAWVKSTPRIRSNASYLAACDALKTFQAMRREVRKHFRKYKDHLNEHRKMLMADEREHLDRIVPAEERLQKLILSYEDRREAEAQKVAEAARENHNSTTVSEASLVVPEPRGQYRREYNRIVVSDLLTLVREVAEGRIPIEALQPNTVYLNQLLAKQGSALFSVPGVNVEQYSKVVTR